MPFKEVFYGGKRQQPLRYGLLTRVFPILPGGYFIVGLGRDMPAVNTLLVVGEHTCQREVTVMQRKYALQRVTGVPQKTCDT
jgi:hypothetical protein